jgi:aarF domain-containing kinase
MVFEDNYIHADMHPGNILVQQNQVNFDSSSLLVSSDEYVGDVEQSGDLRLVVLDCGLTTELREEDRRNFLEVFKVLPI